MKSLACLPFIVVVALLATAPLASAENSDLAELKAMVRSMQKTVAEQTKTIAEQNARIATLEKQQAGPKAKPAGQPAASGRSVAVAGMDVPIAELPAGALPKERSAVRDADTSNDFQQAAPRANNAPLDPKLEGFIAIPGTDTHPTNSFRIGLEYLYGRKETLDGSERDGHRFNLVVRYDLVR